MVPFRILYRPLVFLSHGQYLGLTWVKTRSRRGTAAEVDADGPGEPEEVSTSPEQNFHEYKESGLPNVRKSECSFSFRLSGSTRVLGPAADG